MASSPATAAPTSAAAKLYGRAVLTVVPTPLGNLRDITLRALDALAAARRDRLRGHAPHARAAECARHPGAGSRGLRRAPRGARGERSWRALAGEQVALVSDSGMPLIADPGRLLVARALAAGCPVTVLPGTSAVETALVASGLAAEGYAFLGWVPRASGERARFLTAALAGSLPSVMFESPRRLAATLTDLARFAPEHPVAVARELTKLHEEVVHGSAAEVAARGVMEAARSASWSRPRRAPSAGRRLPRRSRRCANSSRWGCRLAERASSWPG